MTSADAQKRFFYTALSAAALAYAIVVINAYTRLSEARLDYQLWSEHYAREAASAMVEDVGTTSEPVVAASYHDSPWEHRVHPFVTAALALLVLRLAYLGWGSSEKKVTRQFVVPVVIFLLLFTLVLPDVIDAHPRPPAMMVQLAGALMVTALLWWLVVREQRFWTSVSETALTRALRPRALIALGLVAMQTALGAWSNVNHVGVPCADFPTCEGAWWPAMDLTQVFGAAVSIEAGETPSLWAITLHMLHRLGGLVTLLYVGWLGLHMFRAGVEENLCRYGLLISVLLLCQVSLGVMVVVMELPLATALAHSAVSALLLLSIVTLYHVVRPLPVVTGKKTKQA